MGFLKKKYINMTVYKNKRSISLILNGRELQFQKKKKRNINGRLKKRIIHCLYTKSDFRTRLFL